MSNSNGNGASFSGSVLGDMLGAMSGYVSTASPGLSKMFGAFSTFFTSAGTTFDNDGFTARDAAGIIGATAAGLFTGVAAATLIPGLIGIGVGTAFAPLLAGAVVAAGLGYAGGLLGELLYDGLSQALSYFFDVPPTSPLILDLDLDGQIELTPLSDTSTSFFDLDADGFVEQTGWVTSDDGLLAIDVNGDGIINDINELFGNATTDGFIELAALDSNGDHVIDANDAQFGDLLVWQDADGDGYSDAGELTSLASWNISSIDLNYTTVNGTNQGHDVSTESTVSLSGGGSMLIQDIWFQHNQANSFYVVPDSFTYDSDVFELPQAANDNAPVTSVILYRNAA